MLPQVPGRLRAAVVYHPAKVARVPLREVVAGAEDEHGWAPSTWHRTSSDDSGRQAAADALAESPNVVIIAGGDGTVRVVAETLQSTGVPVALVPLGTGNLLARNLRLPLADLDRLVEIAFAGETHHIDVAVADFEDGHGRTDRQMFVVMAGIGLDAAMAETTNALAKRHLGWLAYVIPIARSIMGNKQFELHYRIDGGRTRSTRAHTVIVGNCGTLTGNMLLLPEAVLDDGLVDVVMFRPTSGGGWVRVGAHLTVQGFFRGPGRRRKQMRDLIPALRALRYAQGRQMDVRFEVPHRIELDGDIVGSVTTARITVRPAALAIRRPPAMPPRESFSATKEHAIAVTPQ